jgi:hypothetical protein
MFLDICSKGGGSSPGARMAGIRISPESHPAFLAATPPLHYSDIRIDGVSFLLPPGLYPFLRNPYLVQSCSSPSDGSIRLVLPLALLNPG